MLERTAQTIGLRERMVAAYFSFRLCEFALPALQLGLADHVGLEQLIRPLRRTHRQQSL